MAQLREVCHWIPTLSIVSFCSIHEDTNEDESQKTEQTPSVWLPCPLTIVRNQRYTLIQPNKSFFYTIQTIFHIHRSLDYHSPGHSARYRHYLFEEYASMFEAGSGRQRQSRQKMRWMWSNGRYPLLP